jgi:hypothetical protein
VPPTDIPFAYDHILIVPQLRSTTLPPLSRIRSYYSGWRREKGTYFYKSGAAISMKNEIKRLPATQDVVDLMSTIPKISLVNRDNHAPELRPCLFLIRSAA